MCLKIEYRWSFRFAQKIQVIHGFLAYFDEITNILCINSSTNLSIFSSIENRRQATPPFRNGGNPSPYYSWYPPPATGVPPPRTWGTPAPEILPSAPAVPPHLGYPPHRGYPPQLEYPRTFLPPRDQKIPKKSSLNKFLT